jgi:5'-deoxy-5'-methylthioadenosine phosphorylase
MTFGLIGGTGLEQLPDVTLAASMTIETPFGDPSAPLQRFDLRGRTVWFVSRHGPDHQLAPHRVNYRANLWAMQQVGATDIIALNAVGVIDDTAAPGELALPHQIIDYTWGRESTFFDGVHAPLQHIELSDPYSEGLRRRILQAAAGAGIALPDRAVYGATQGPRLETRAEIDRLERDGVSLVGMTGQPEAALARELGLEYACIALIVNYAAGRGELGIHDELEQSMAGARGRALELVRIIIEQS